MADLVYKVDDATAFDKARQEGVYSGAPIDAQDGFIHLSTGTQLAETLRRHFAGRKDLLIAAFDPDTLGENLRWEVSRGGALFPHYYGTLDPRQIAWTAPIDVAEDGSCTLPDRIG